MQLSLRSILPLSLSGVLAFMGLWWYVSRKKSSSSDGDVQGKKTGAECSSASDGNGPKEEKGTTVEHGVVAGTKGAAVSAERATLPVDSSSAAVEAEPAADLFPGSPAETTARSEPEPAEEALLRKTLLSSNHEDLLSSNYEDQVPTCGLGSGPSHSVLGDTKGVVRPPSPPPPRSPDVPGVASTEWHAEGKRLDPEGDVGGGDVSEGKMTVCFAEHGPRSDLSESWALSKEMACPGPPPAAAEPVCDLGLTDPQSPPATPSPPGYTGAEKMQQLAEGLISDMVSAAVAEVLQARTAETSLPEQGSSALCTREPCATAPDAGPEDSSETQRDSLQRREHEDAILTADGESGMSPAPQEYASGPEARRTGLVDDDSSSTSSSQAEDSSSDEDNRVLSRPGAEVPEDSKDLDQSSKTTKGQPEVLRNGHGTEEKRPTQDHGMTSNCEQGSLQPNLSSQTPPQPTEPQTIWEFEVPKHLVGRLIGKQGRYVSYLEASSGATVFISTVPYSQDVQVCHIEGTKGQVEIVLDLIRNKFKDLDLTNCYTQAPVRSLPALPITSWLLMPHGVTVEVKVVQVASGNYLFLQQHTHPTFHALRVLDQQMRLCYSQPGCPSLPAPVEVGVICAAQMAEGAWWRAQVMSFNENNKEVEIRYVDYGGYHTVNIDNLRQIRSDFVSLPFQGSEVILENLAPLSGEEEFSAAAKSALQDLTQGVSLLAQVTEFHTSGIPLVQMWRKEENQLVCVNQALVERGVCSWINRP